MFSSHGLLFEDDGWSWVCEELIGEAGRSAALHTGVATLVATSQGMLRSEDGCDWQWVESLTGRFVSGAVLESSESGSVWATTLDGLWWSDDHGQTFTDLGRPSDLASLRSLTRASDGTLYMLGFDDVTPTAWVGDGVAWQSAPLPVSGGRLELVGVDSLGRAYGRFPYGDGLDELLRVDQDAQVSPLGEWTANIAAFAEIDGRLTLSLRGLGMVWSDDDGLSWTEPEGSSVSCLHPRGDKYVACPEAGSGSALQEATPTSEPALAWDWRDVVVFRDIEQPRCEDGTFASSVCDELWDTVRDQLDPPEAVDTSLPEPMDTGAPGSDEDLAACGCGHQPYGGWSWLLLLGLSALRRRSAHEPCSVTMN